MERRDKINYYLDIAETVSKRSTCLRRIYGAVIVKNDEIITARQEELFGFKLLPAGEDGDPARGAIRTLPQCPCGSERDYKCLERENAGRDTIFGWL